MFSHPRIMTTSLFVSMRQTPVVDSHLGGVFERGASPVEVPEMQSVAKQILSKIEEDPDQYNALLQSIGSPQEPIIAKDDNMNKALSQNL